MTETYSYIWMVNITITYLYNFFLYITGELTEIFMIGLFWTSTILSRHKREYTSGYKYFDQNMRDVPKVIPPIYFHKYYNRYRRHNNNVGENKFSVTIFTNTSTRAGYDTRSIFKRSLTGLNSDFSLS